MTTATQRDVELFDSVLDIFASVAQQARKAIASISALSHLQPSEWVDGTTIVAMSANRSRKVSLARLQRMVAIGWLESRPTDGFGPEYSISHGVTLLRGLAGR